MLRIPSRSAELDVICESLLNTGGMLTVKRKMRRITMDIRQTAGTRERNPEAATTPSINTATGEKDTALDE